MNLSISLTVDEVNFIINTIAEKPYNQVADLLQKIRQQALDQVNPAPKGTPDLYTPTPEHPELDDAPLAHQHPDEVDGDEH